MNTDNLQPVQGLSIFPLGDSAITIDLGGRIDEELNRKALAIQEWLVAHRFPGVKDIIVAYSSVSVFYDPVLVRTGAMAAVEGAFGCMKKRLEEAWREATVPPGRNGEMIRMPACYESDFGPDLATLSKEKGISREEVIDLHVSRIYRVYMIGFLPGFSYLGMVDERLQMPRKGRPVPIMAGSIGIAGSQTGIYPLNSPGGWQIIGRTPVKLFDPQAEIPVRLKIGDHVQFYPVRKQEFLDIAASFLA